MSDKRAEAAEEVLDAYGHSFQACDYAVKPNDYVARGIVTAIDEADDCVRVPRNVLRSWAMLQDRPGMTDEIESYL